MSIGKLISVPTECGYRCSTRMGTTAGDYSTSWCGHFTWPTNRTYLCNDHTTFPHNCPLQNAIAIEQMRGMSTTIIPIKKKKRYGKLK